MPRTYREEAHATTRPAATVGDPVNDLPTANLRALFAALRESAPAESTASILANLASMFFPSVPGSTEGTGRDRLNGRTAAASASEELTPEQRSLAQLRAAELRYRTLVEQIPAVTFMAGLGEGPNEIYVSPHIEALLGFTQREWLEDPFLWFTQLHPDDQQLICEEFARGLRTGGPFRAECRLIARDGRIVWVRGEARLIRDERGRPLFLQGVAFDITESKQAEAILLQQAVTTTEERYRDIVEQLGAIFWEAETSTGRFSFVSGGAERILGFPASAWLRDPEFWLSRLHEEDRDRVEGTWRTLLRQGGDDEFEFRARAADGRLIWLHEKLHVPPPNRRDARAVGVILDVTDRKRTEEAALRLAAIVESTDDAIVGKDLDGTIASWNPAAERVFGYPASEAVGQPFRLVFPPDRGQEEDDVLARVRSGQRVPTYETVRRRKDGSTFHASVTISPVMDGTGRVVGASNVTRDITKQKMAEEQLRSNAIRLEAEAALRRTLHRIGTELASELTLEHVVQLATDEATALTRAEFGAFFHNIVNERGEAHTLYAFSGMSRDASGGFPVPMNAFLLGTTFRGEGIVRIDDITADPRYGHPPYHATPEARPPVSSYLAVPVVSRSGEVLGGMFFGHSAAARFTEEHEKLAVGIAGWTALAIDNARLYTAAERARQTAEAANRAKDEFLAMMSHELRTPLNAVLGWLQVLRTGIGQPEDRTRALATIERNARAQAQIIDDLLDVSRIVTGKFVVKNRPVDLRPVVESALETVNLAIQAKAIRLTTSLGEAAIVVWGDADRLQQVVMNLLTNAVKFTPAGGRIDVRVDAADGTARIQVADTGQGIEPAVLPRVFERFWQHDSSITRAHGGLGLGLAIVRHIVELHGGRVAAESEGAGKGATFTIEIPLNGPAAGADAWRTRYGAGDEFPSLAGARIVVVDDQPDSRELLQSILTSAGADVVDAGTAEEGIRAVIQTTPHVVICDIGMPGRDGFEFLRSVRALDGGCAAVPVIAVTAYARDEDRQRALDAGFEAHIGKPVDVATLLRTTADLLASVRDK